MNLDRKTSQVSTVKFFIVTTLLLVLTIITAASLTGCSGGTKGISGTWYQSGSVKTGTLEINADETTWKESYSGLAGFGSSSGTIEKLGGNEYQFTRGNGGTVVLTLSDNGQMLGSTLTGASVDIGGNWYRSQEEAANHPSNL